MNLMHRLYLFLLPLLISFNVLSEEKSFDGITCQSNISVALIGRAMPNERVMVIEERYKNIGLEDLGAFGMEPQGDPWTLISWLICGREYALLEKNHIVKDVLESPFVGSYRSQIVSCSVNGSKIPETAVVFINPEVTKWPMTAKNAWLIDDNAVKFVSIVGNEIICSP